MKWNINKLFGFESTANKETQEYSTKLCCSDKDKLVKYIIIEKCSDIKGIYASEDNCLHLKGKHSMHDIMLGRNGSSITSSGNDRRTILEARNIMKFLSCYQGC